MWMTIVLKYVLHCVSNQCPYQIPEFSSYVVLSWPYYTALHGSVTWATIRGGKPSHTHSWMQISNPSTSAKPTLTMFQNSFVALENMDIFQMTLKFNLFTADYKCNFCWNIVSTFLCMWTCRMFAVSAAFRLLLNFHSFSVNLNLCTARLQTPDHGILWFLVWNLLTDLLKAKI